MSEPGTLGRGPESLVDLHRLRPERAAAFAPRRTLDQYGRYQSLPLLRTAGPTTIAIAGTRTHIRGSRGSRGSSRGSRVSRGSFRSSFRGSFRGRRLSRCHCRSNERSATRARVLTVLSTPQRAEG